MLDFFLFQGATSLSGDGCFMADWGCPLHKGPADGHVVTTGSIYRDVYAEQHDGAAVDQEACLNRAVNQWRYCGSHSNHPITSIYRPTGLTKLFFLLTQKTKTKFNGL